MFSASDLNPVTWGLNLGVKAGTVIGNSIINKEPVGKSLAEVLSRPAAPVIINNPPGQKGLLDSFGIGFVEKNLIILGAFGLGAVAIYSSINKSRRA